MDLSMFQNKKALLATSILLLLLVTSFLKQNRLENQADSNANVLGVEEALPILTQNQIAPNPYVKPQTVKSLLPDNAMDQRDKFKEIDEKDTLADKPYGKPQM